MGWCSEDTLALRQDLAVLTMTLDLLDDCPAIPDDLRPLVATARSRMAQLVQTWGDRHASLPAGAGSP